MPQFDTKILIFMQRSSFPTANLLFRLIFNKYICCLFIVQLFILESFGQLIATKIGGNGGDEVLDVAVYQETIFVGGMFQQDLGVPSRGGSDVFFQAYNLQGVVEWQYTLGGIDNDVLQTLTVAGDGSIYAMGTFRDSLWLGTDTLLFSANQAVFITKLNAQGQLLWAKRWLGTGLVEVQDMICDSLGNFYCTGAFQDTFVVDNQPLIGTDALNAFLLKVDENGTVVWTKKAAYNSEEAKGVALTMDEDGQLYWAGEFKGFFAIESDTVRAHWVYSDLFLAKLNAQGQVLWQRHYGGVYHNRCTVLKYKNGFLYLGGHFMGILNIDGQRLATAFRQWDGFIAQLDTSGGARWAVQSLTQALCYVEDVVVHNQGLIALGTYKDSLNWGNKNLTGVAEQDIYQVEMDLDGQVEFLTSWDGEGFDLVRAAAWHSNGWLISVGSFQENMSLAGDTILNASGFADGFLSIQSIDTTITTHLTPIVELVEVTIIPNPAADSLEIRTNAALIERWYLYNMKGQAVLTGRGNWINIETLPKGIYSLQVSTNRGIGVNKVIKR